MPTPVLCLAAAAVIRDGETNQISVFSILNNWHPKVSPRSFRK